MNIQDVDIAILRLINQPYLTQLNLFFIIGVFLIYVFLFGIAFILFRKKQFRKLNHLVVASIIGYVLIFILKILVNRPRPYETFTDIIKIFSKSDPSFPSAHTALAFLAFYFIPKDLPKWLRYLFYIYFLILIPVASMYSGVHYPSDVFAGAMFGIIFPRVISENFSIKLMRKIFRLK